MMLTVVPQLGRQPVVSVEIDLQAAGQLGRNSRIVQPQVLIKEIVAVVLALALVRAQERLAGGQGL